MNQTEVAITGRRCGHCNTVKPLKEFSRSKNKSSWCRDCCAENARKWRAANIERARDYDRRRQDRQRTGRAKEWMRFYRWLKRHNLRPEDYHALFEGQGGVCAICGRPPEEGRFLHVDHDHACCPAGTSCGACRRGLLCPPCNQGIGSLGDDPARLRSAAEYLERFTAG